MSGRPPAAAPTTRQDAPIRPPEVLFDYEPSAWERRMTERVRAAVRSSGRRSQGMRYVIARGAGGEMFVGAIQVRFLAPPDPLRIENHFLAAGFDLTLDADAPHDVFVMR